MKLWMQTVLLIVISAILTRLLPFSAFFRNVDTLVHEFSHAVVTLLLSGSVMSIQLFTDQSGVTYSAVGEAWKLIPIALAGYPGAALFALLLFRLHAAGRQQLGLLLVACIAFISLVLFVRNDYGVLWCIGFAAATALIGLLGPNWLRRGYYLLIAFIVQVESIISSVTILIIALLQPGSAGDAANLSRATGVPAALWGLLFAVISLWCAKSAVARLLRRKRSAAGAEALRL